MKAVRFYAKEDVRVDNVASPELRQLFFRDPAGNVLELHQIGRCRCRRSNRQFSDEKTKAASQSA